MKAERNLASSIFMPLLFAIINFIWVEGQLKSIVGYKLSGFSISARELLGILVLWVCSGFWCILFWPRLVEFWLVLAPR